MMDIALIGAPETGKTDLALDLNDYLSKDGKVLVIDGYADKVSDDTHLAVGEYAGYIGSLLILAARLKDEIAVIKGDWDHSICCGTIIETITYASINSAMASTTNRDRARKNATFLQIAGMVMSDMFIYNHHFYLPYTGENERWQRFDLELQQALVTFNIPYARLDGENKLEGALKIIEAEPATVAE